MGKIIITGVDGNFGSHTAKTILELVPADRLIFTAPVKEALSKYEAMGVETRKADFNDPAQLEEAFAGGDTLLLISMPFVGDKRKAAHKAAIDAAKAAGVKKVIYTSVAGAGNPDCVAYEILDHTYTEQYIKDSGLDYIIMRDSQYAEAMIAAFFEAYANTGGVLSNNMGDGLMSHVSRFNCAEAAAYLAAGKGEVGETYAITGPTIQNMTEFCRVGSEASGKKVEYNYITDEETYAFFDSLGVPRRTDGEWAESAKNFPFCSEGMVTYGTAIREGQFDQFSDDYEKLTGKKPYSLAYMFAHPEEFPIGQRVSTD